MKTLIVAKVQTHHNSSALRGLNLKTYKQFPTGVHQTVEDFKTMKEAREHLKGRDTKHVHSIRFLTGWEREEYRDLGYLEY